LGLWGTCEVSWSMEINETVKVLKLCCKAVTRG
jgi:hypothetical protein